MATLESWKKSKTHEVTLPSGTKVEIVIPNLPQMLKGGEIPNPLVDAALKQVSGGLDQPDRDQIEQLWDFYAYLVTKMVVKPKVSEAEVAELPFEDVQMLVEFASRERDLDAVYHHLSGLERSADFRKFRGLEGGEALVPGL